MDDSDLQKHLAWTKILSEYFESHIRQRFLLINYFIIITSSLVVAANYSQKIPDSLIHPKWPLIFLGMLMIVVTFIFWNLEKRVSFLIKRCHTRLVLIEQELLLNTSMKLFSTEEDETFVQRKKPLGFFQSYSKCFNGILISALIGYLGFIVAVYAAGVSDCENLNPGANLTKIEMVK